MQKKMVYGFFILVLLLKQKSKYINKTFTGRY
jgi:hypothetical protein